MQDAQLIPTVNVEEAEFMVSNGALLVDVREQDEWDEERIANAKLMPLSDINTWYSNLPTHQNIVFYCHSGNRSGQVVAALVQQVGMTNVHNMAGGITAWTHSQRLTET